MQSWFVTLRKTLEELEFVDEEFLHNEVNTKIHVDTEDQKIHVAS